MTNTSEESASAAERHLGTVEEIVRRVEGRQTEIEAALNKLRSQADAAAESLRVAEGSRSQTEAAQGQAERHRDAASAAQREAESHKEQAATSRSQSEQHRDAAGAAKDETLNSKTQAIEAKSQTEAQRDVATQAAGEVIAAKDRAARAAEDAEAGRERARVAGEEAAALKSQAEAALTDAHTHRGAIEASARQAGDLVAKIEELRAKANDNKTVTDGVLEAANQLRAQIAEQQESLSKFEAEMAGRLKLFAEFTQDVGEFKRKSVESMGEIDRILSRSREVLGEATVAGLSDRYKAEMNSISRRLLAVQITFYVSLVFVLISGGAIFGLFPWLEKMGITQYRETPLPTSSEWGPLLVGWLASSFGKVILLAPAFLMVVFTLRRQSELARLQSEYTFKYTVAASLAGFKTEAPTHAEAIVAAAFKEMLYNPMEKFAARPEQDAAPSWLERLLTPHIKKVFDKVVEGEKDKKPSA